MITPYSNIPDASMDEDQMAALIASQQQAMPADPKVAAQRGQALRQSPEWQRQSQGLDQLQHLVSLEAMNNAKKTSVDLSPLGAYLDYQNSLRGKPTNIAKSAQVAPIEETSIKDLGEIQRRRGDMVKELAGVLKQPAGSVNGPNNLHFRETSALRKYTDNLFKEPAHQLSVINNMVDRVKSENPSYIGALPAKLEQMDTGQQRVLLGLIGMETYDNSAPAKLSQYLKTLSSGQLSDHTKALLIDRLNRSADDAHLNLQALEEDARAYANTLPSVGGSDIEGIVGSKIKTIKKANPRAMAAGGAGEKFVEGGSAAPEAPKKPSLSAEDMQQIMNAVNGGK